MAERAGFTLATLASLLAALAVVGAARAPGYVHTRLESTVPADGDTLAHLPDRFELRFTGAVNSALSDLLVVTPRGDSLRVSLESGENDRILVGHPPALPPGRYRLLWKTVSSDGHPVSGEFVFVLSGPPDEDTRAASDTIGTDRGATGTVGGEEDRTGAERPMQTGAEGAEGESAMAGAGGAPAGVVVLGGLGIFFLLGFAGLLWHGRSTALLAEPRVGSTVRAFGWAALFLGVGDLALWIVRVVPTGAGLSTYGAALGTTTGLFGGLRLVLVCLALAQIARRPRVSAGIALASVLVGAAAGHPAAFSPWLTVPANALHLAAATIWLGGLLLLVSLPESPSDGSTGWNLGGTVRSVSGSALLAVILIFVSGVVQSARFLGGVGDLAGTEYGRGILVKSAGLLVLIGFGAFHRTRVLPHLADDGGRTLRRTVRLEMVVMLLVVLAAAWLARVSPPIEL